MQKLLDSVKRGTTYLSASEVLFDIYIAAIYKIQLHLHLFNGGILTPAPTHHHLDSGVSLYGHHLKLPPTFQIRWPSTQRCVK